MNANSGVCAALACSVLALLAACSTPATRVVLLPQADGSPSAVVVRSKNGEQLVDQPYQRATIRGSAAGAPTVDRVDPAALRKDNAALFDLLPPPPLSYTLYFELGGTDLTDASKREISAMLDTAMQRTGADIVVTGHTDTVGAGTQNDELSQRRAEQIRQLLIQHGFPAARIEAVGRGERELVVPTADGVDEPRNRRVTVQVR